MWSFISSSNDSSLSICNDSSNIYNHRHHGCIKPVVLTPVRSFITEIVSTKNIVSIISTVEWEQWTSESSPNPVSIIVITVSLQRLFQSSESSPNSAQWSKHVRTSEPRRESPEGLQWIAQLPFDHSIPAVGWQPNLGLEVETVVPTIRSLVDSKLFWVLLHCYII